MYHHLSIELNSYSTLKTTLNACSKNGPDKKTCSLSYYHKSKNLNPQDLPVSEFV